MYALVRMCAYVYGGARVCVYGGGCVRMWADVSVHACVRDSHGRMACA